MVTYITFVSPLVDGLWKLPKLLKRDLKYLKFSIKKLEILEIFYKEIPKLKSKIKSVQLCFTTDPFMYGYDEVSQMSIAIMRKLNANGIKRTALTKGILPFELSWLSKDNEYGILSVFYFLPTADL